MAYSLGIDIGTTFSAAAVQVDDGAVELINLGGRAPAIPSVILTREDGVVLVGDAAEARAIADPTRVAREFKRRLGDPTPLLLGGTPFSAQTLTSLLIRHVLELVAQRMGGSPASVVITHPAAYGEYRREALLNAAIEAGAQHLTLLSEPQAAAAQYAARSSVAPGEIIAVYDFGGGTFDIALMRQGVGQFELIGVPVGVESLGGVDFDVAVLEHVNARVNGALDLLDPNDDDTRAMLARLRRDSRDAKEALSSDIDATITVVVPGITEHVTITRATLEDLIRPRIAETFVALRRAVEAAGITVDDISRILLVGGSSRIPYIRERVAIETARPLAEDIDPEYAVALGAARLATSAMGGSPIPSPAPDARTEAPRPPAPSPATEPDRPAAEEAAPPPVVEAVAPPVPVPVPTPPAERARFAPATPPPVPRSGPSRAVIAAVVGVLAIAAVAVVVVVTRGGDDSRASSDTAASLTTDASLIVGISEGGVLTGAAELEAQQAVFSPDGTRAVVAGNLGVAVYDGSTGQQLLALAGHSDRVVDAEFSADGTRIVTASIDGRAIVWDATSGAVLLTLTGPAGGPSTAVFDPDGGRIATGRVDDGTVTVWDAATGDTLRSVTGYDPHFDATGHHLLTAGTNTVTIWDADTGAVVREIRSPGVSRAVFSPDGTSLATNGADGVTVWDAADGAPLHVIHVGQSDAFDLAFSPDGTRIATVGLNGSLALFDVTTGQQIGHATTSISQTVAFSPDGAHLITTGANAATVWTLS